MFNGGTTQALDRVGLGSSSVFAAGSLAVTASPAAGTDGAMVIDGTILSPGRSTAIINGQTISDACGGLVAIGPSGIDPQSGDNRRCKGDAQAMAIGSLTITASALPGQSGVYVVDGSTLSPGGSAVAVGNGTTVSDRSGTLVQADSRMTPALSTLTSASSATNSRGSPSVDGPVAASTSRSAAEKAVGRLRFGVLAVVSSYICIMI